MSTGQERKNSPSDRDLLPRNTEFEKELVMLEIRSDMHLAVVIDPTYGTPGSWNDGATLEYPLRHVGFQCVESEALIFLRRVEENAARSHVTTALMHSVQACHRLSIWRCEFSTLDTSSSA